MAHRNRWFTELKTGGSFHGKLLNSHMVVINIVINHLEISIYTSLVQVFSPATQRDWMELGSVAT